MRTARTLGRRGRHEKPGRGACLPSLLFLTDPVRTPDPVAIAARLPRGSGVVYRAFGATDAEGVGRRLAAMARRRGLVLLVGADQGLAAAVGARGLHLPERAARSAPAVRARRPGWLLTCAAHSPRALALAARAGCDAALVSTVFESASPSAGPPMGPVRFAALVRRARLPVYALGGIDARTARRLLGSGAVGMAMVEGLAAQAGR